RGAGAGEERRSGHGRQTCQMPRSHTFHPRNCPIFSHTFVTDLPFSHDLFRKVGPVGWPGSAHDRRVTGNRLTTWQAGSVTRTSRSYASDRRSPTWSASTSSSATPEAAT